jgi:hypothetical protein
LAKSDLLLQASLDGLAEDISIGLALDEDLKFSCNLFSN